MQAHFNIGSELLDALSTDKRAIVLVIDEKSAPDVRYWPVADIWFCAAQVCFWPKADIPSRTAHVRCWG